MKKSFETDACLARLPTAKRARFHNILFLTIGCLLAFAAGPDPAHAAFEQAGKTLHLRDQIVRTDLFQFLEAFTASVKEAPDSKQITVHLNSDGGDLEAAFSIASIIRAAQKGGYSIAATVPAGGRCNSACVVIFAAAAERNAWEDSTFLLHGIAYAGFNPSPAILQKHGQMVDEMQAMIDAADPAFGSFVRRHKIIEHDLDMTFSGRQLYDAFGGFITDLN